MRLKSAGRKHNGFNIYEAVSVEGTRAYRVIREDDGWRLDTTFALLGHWLPWEAVTPTRYPTLKEARAAFDEHTR